MNQNAISNALVMYKCALRPHELAGISAMGDAGILQTGVARKGLEDKELGRCGGGKGSARMDASRGAPLLALRVRGTDGRPYPRGELEDRLKQGLQRVNQKTRRESDLGRRESTKQMYR